VTSLLYDTLRNFQIDIHTNY